MLEVLALSVIILIFCFALLGIKVIVKRSGTFSQTRMSGHSGLQKKGIKCAQVQDFEAQKQMGLFERMSKEV